MNLKCQKKHKTVIWGNIISELFPGNPALQERDTVAPARRLLDTQHRKGNSGWAQVRGRLAMLSSTSGAPQTPLLSSCPGCTSAAPAAMKGVILGR